MSYQLALQLADEWEHTVREYKKTHEQAVNGILMQWIEADAQAAGSPCNGIWNYRDVAQAACKILAERIGEEYKYDMPRKLI